MTASPAVPRTSELLTRIGLPAEDPGAPPLSEHRFADGTSYPLRDPQH